MHVLDVAEFVESRDDHAIDGAESVVVVRVAHPVVTRETAVDKFVVLDQTLDRRIKVTERSSVDPELLAFR